MRWLEHATLGQRWAVTLGVFLGIVFVDVLTGADLTLHALYLVPVALAAWALGRRAGVLFSVASVGITLYYDHQYGLTSLHPMFFYTDAAIRLAVYLGATWVLRALHEAYARLDALAQTDPLTRLYNRRGFQRLAERELVRATRAGSGLTLVHIDLDGFKAVNDTRGHGEGDAILAAVGDTLAHGRATDIAARLGGDEFALLLPHDRGDEVERATERIAGELTHRMRAGGWPITFSIGVATYAVPPRTLAEMVAAADALMYEVKHGGKAGVRRRELGAG